MLLKQEEASETASYGRASVACCGPSLGGTTISPQCWYGCSKSLKYMAVQARREQRAQQLAQELIASEEAEKAKVVKKKAKKNLCIVCMERPSRTVPSSTALRTRCTLHRVLRPSAQQHQRGEGS